MSLDVDKILKEKGLNRSKLSELMGSNRSYVTNILKNPTLETLEKIADTLNVDLKDLLSQQKRITNLQKNY